MTVPAGLVSFRLNYELCPIFLTGGAYANLSGGGLPIISITQGISFPNGILSSLPPDTNTDDFFAHFRPLPGGTLIDNDLGRYPFANQAVAANAIIAQPLRVSLMMWAPVNQPGGYASKVSTIQAVQSALYQHAALGGTFTVATPSYYYVNAILLKLTDITEADSKQAQSVWQWDFEQPLITQQQAQSVQNTLMTRMTNLLPVSGDPPSYSGVGPTTGNPASGATPSLIPAAGSLGGAIGTSPGIVSQTGGAS
jgi:hypothetical protein